MPQRKVSPERSGLYLFLFSVMLCPQHPLSLSSIFPPPFLPFHILSQLPLSISPSLTTHLPLCSILSLPPPFTKFKWCWTWAQQERSHWIDGIVTASFCMLSHSVLDRGGTSKYDRWSRECNKQNYPWAKTWERQMAVLEVLEIDQLPWSPKTHTFGKLQAV